jgi:hypothetical protein
MRTNKMKQTLKDGGTTPVSGQGCRLQSWSSSLAIWALTIFSWTPSTASSGLIGLRKWFAPLMGPALLRSLAFPKTTLS